MRALIVGAGAVGQVYGLTLQRAGAQVGVFVKPKHAAAARAGYTLHPVGGARVGFQPDHCVVDAEGVGQQGPWDQVWLCMSSPGLRGWTDAGPALRAAGPDATVICLQPGLDDGVFVADHLGDAERVVHGLITMISWHAPLPGESTDPPGVAYWLPPAAAPPFSGDERRVDPIVRALGEGGYKARRVDDVPSRTAFGAATLLPIIAALEAADWSLSGLRKGPWIGVGARAARESQALVAAHLGVAGGSSLLRLLLAPPVLRLGAAIAPIAAPFPLEVYLKTHFTKVGDQTLAHLRRYLDLGAERGLPTAHLRQLRDALLTRRPDGSPVPGLAPSSKPAP